ncbi:hypothetical protein JAAARDRAFT_529856 [Jaapia argillacea MUCL 33604]|uniref:Uncharacterized protein n=1 Tax=Jaapia argillacea MUCL 33604 TaxID=933084 RepID=A0A067PC96_9AGAM|nr:hypothetical protein JAAARDRAFT_529856 [Jaapia argillacea MUCL 33604]
MRMPSELKSFKSYRCDRPVLLGVNIRPLGTIEHLPACLPFAYPDSVGDIVPHLIHQYHCPTSTMDFREPKHSKYLLFLFAASLASHEQISSERAPLRR